MTIDPSRPDETLEFLQQFAKPNGPDAHIIINGDKYVWGGASWVLEAEVNEKGRQDDKKVQG